MLITLALLSPLQPALRPALVAPSRAAFVRASTEVEVLQELPLVDDGSLTKSILREGEESGGTPQWAAMVSVHFTGRFPNGTVFDEKFANKPFEFQLNANAVVDGMERGVASMLPGERALLTCEPRWAYGGVGVGSRIPPNATLVYDVELLSWKEGPPVDNDELDMHTYRSSLEGKAAASGRTASYRWSEGGEEVTLWLPLREGEGARDVECEFGLRTVRVGFKGGAAADEGAEAREVVGDLKGRIRTDDSYWVIDDEQGVRELQVVLAKAGAFTRWDGVLIGEEELNEE